LPIGVRAAATITASFIVFSLINRMLIDVAYIILLFTLQGGHGFHNKLFSLLTT